MSGEQAGSTNRGNQADYMLGTAEGWDAFGVVRWHGVEEISRPFLYDITLTRDASSGPVDLDTLLDTGATFAIHGQSGWRMVHGVLAEAAEIDQTSQTILYRVLLVPHVWHARNRQRCRNFLKKTLRDIVSAVLENRSPAHPGGLGGTVAATGASPPDQSPSFTSFTAATAAYRWDVKDTSRILNPNAYPYVVQYNESDFDFFSRLLEHEGLSYYFEQGGDQVVLAITDVPGVSPELDPNATFDMHRVSSAGNTQGQEIIRWFYDVRRLRSRAVTVRDWDYFRSNGPLQATVSEATGDRDLVDHFEFPAGEESIKQNPGEHAAKIRVERYDVERAMHEGASTVRSMMPGYRFTLHDADGTVADTKLLAVRVETYATARALTGTLLDELPFGFAHTTGALTVGFDSRFLALDASLTFCPAMRTPKPRIHGVQAAVVSAEEYPEGERPVVNGDNLGRVRVRFPWDQRDDKNDKTPTSRWIRVSQFWAGAGYGALYTPRVGHEVLVAYMQGDPDQPVIVGRVYNATHVPPYEADADPTKSTVKSRSAQQLAEVDGFNEIRFEDKAQNEQIYLHAQRNLDEVVLAAHNTSVGGDQTNVVSGSQVNHVDGDREHEVGGEEHVTVVRDRTTLFKLNEHHTVLVSRDTHIHSSELHQVDVYRKTEIGGNDDLKVKGWRNAEVKGGDTLDVTDQRHVKVGGGLTTDVKGDTKSIATGEHLFTSKRATFELTEEFHVKVGSTELRMTPGHVHLKNGTVASIALNGGSIQINAAENLTLNGKKIDMTSDGQVNIVGTAIDLGDGK